MLSLLLPLLGFAFLDSLNVLNVGVTTAVVYGCSGPRLTEAERAFFAEARPWGFILFRRNIETPEQVRALTDDLRR